MDISTVGLDLAKNVFQVHAIDSAGKVIVRRSLRRRQVMPFFTKLEPCLIGMEACGTSHFWGRELQALGHEVKLMPPIYVTPYVKRHSYQVTSLRYSKSKVFSPDPMPTGMLLPVAPQRPAAARVHRRISPMAHPCRPDGQE